MTWTPLLLAALIAVQTGQVPSHPRWAPGSRVGVWVDARQAPPDGVRMADRAVAQWHAALGGHVELVVVARPEQAQITVSFVRATDVYGETYPHVNLRTGLIDRAEVRISADVPGEPLRGAIVTYLTALHELGHAIGLEHTLEFDDIMYTFHLPDDGARYFARYRARVGTIDDIGSRAASGLSVSDVRRVQDLYGGPR